MLTLIQLKTDEQRKPAPHRLEDDRAYVIGRNRGEIPLDDSRVSRQHAELSVQNGVWVIRDLGSSNGTWVNGQRIAGLCELEEGDRLAIGRVTLIVGHLATDGPAPAQDAAGITAIESTDPSRVDRDAASDLDFEIELEPVDAAVIEDLPDFSLPESIDDAVDTDSHTSADAPADPPEHKDQPLQRPPTAQPPHADEQISPTVDESEVDEYAASVDFVPPTARPESPLDNRTAANDLVPEEVDPVPPSGSDQAPPAVGLSLDQPAPESGPADKTRPNVGAARGHGPDDRPSESPPNPAAEASEAGPEPIESPPTASASPSTAPPADPPPPPPDWAEPEDQQELDDRESMPSSYAGRLAVALLLALTGGGAFWMLYSGDTPESAQVTSATPSTSPPTASPPSPSPASETPAPIVPETTPNPPAIAEAESSSPRPAEVKPGVTPGVKPGVKPGVTPAQTAESPAPPIFETVEPPAAAAPALGQADGSGEQTKPDPFDPTPPLAATIPAPTPRPGPEPAPAPTPADAAEAQAGSHEPPSPVEQPPAAVAAERPVADSEKTAAADPPSVLDASPTPSTDPAPGLALNHPPPAADQSPSASPPAATAQAPRQIVYVVDASGSMVDSMNQGALTWLESRLDALTEQDRFTVLFFRSGEVIEAPPTGLKQADDSTLASLLGWIDPATGNVTLRGQSEPLAALQQAVSYQPTDIYILSDDKFGRRPSANDIAAEDLVPLLGKTPPLVHTVQFFYPDPDDNPLQAIARRFGGEYEFIEEPPFDRDPGRDLGLDLLGVFR